MEGLFLYLAGKANQIMDFITIITTSEDFQVGIIKNLFDMENIEFRVFDEAVNNAAGFAGLGMSGMRVQVSKTDFARAQQILTQAEIL